MDVRPADAFSPYENGLRQLLSQLGEDHPHSREAHIYQKQLLANIHLTRFYGDTEARRAERAQIIDHLNRLALATLNRTFDRLCSQTSPLILARGLQRGTEPLVEGNPFSDRGRIVDPDRFFNHEELMRQVFEALNKGENISLVGPAQIGKSSLLMMIRTLGPQLLRQPHDTFAYLDMHRVNNDDEFYELLCAELGIETCRGLRLARALRGRYHVLCLDGTEKLHDEGFTSEVHNLLHRLARDPAEPLRLVVASAVPLDDLYPETEEHRPSLANICLPFTLEPFSPATARAFIHSRLKDTGVTFSPDQIDMLVAESEGHPLRLQCLATDLYRGYALLRSES